MEQTDAQTLQIAVQRRKARPSAERKTLAGVTYTHRHVPRGTNTRLPQINWLSHSQTQATAEGPRGNKANAQGHTKRSTRSVLCRHEGNDHLPRKMSYPEGIGGSSGRPSRIPLALRGGCRAGLTTTATTISKLIYFRSK